MCRTPAAAPRRAPPARPSCPTSASPPRSAAGARPPRRGSRPGAGPGRRASGTPASRPRSGTARRAAPGPGPPAPSPARRARAAGCRDSPGKRRGSTAPTPAAPTPRCESYPRGTLPRVPTLVLGPLLRYVGETEAVIWVETDSRLRGRGARHARAHVPRLRPPLRARLLRRPRAAAPGTSTRSASTASASGRADDGFPPSAFHTYPKETPLQVAFGSCRVAAPHEPPYTLREGRGRARARDRCAAHAGAAHARRAARALARRAADARRPGLRRRGVARHAVVHRDRAATRPSRPGERVLDFEEYTRLYLESWSEPDDPLAALHVSDGDDLRRPRRPRRLEHLRRRGSRRCAQARLVERAHHGGAVVVLGLPAPRQPRPGGAGTTSCWRR